MKKLISTRERIKKHIETGRKLTPLSAFEKFQTLSLHQHINVLRNRGIEIETEMKTNKNTGIKFAEYSIKK